MSKISAVIFNWTREIDLYSKQKCNFVLYGNGFTAKQKRKEREEEETRGKGKDRH